MLTSDQKGKGRANNPPISDQGPSERTRLLPTTRNNGTEAFPEDGTRRSWLSRAVTAAIIALSITVLFLLLFAILLYSTLTAAPAANKPPKEIFSKGVNWRPTGIDVKGFSRDGLSLVVNGKVGVDTDWMLGLNDAELGWGPWGRAKRAAGRWGVAAVGRVTVDMDPIMVYSAQWDGPWLLNISAQPIEVPLKKRMSQIHIPLLVSLSQNSTDLGAFINQTWVGGVVRVRTNVSRVRVRAGGLKSRSWWKRWLQKTQRDVTTPVAFNLPMPPRGFPQPGNPFPPLSEFFKLDAYTMDVNRTENATSIGFSAHAAVPLPINSSSSINLPSNLPSPSFLISLPSHKGKHHAPLATMLTLPAFNTSGPLVTVSFPVQGTLLPLSAESIPLISSLVSNYIAARSSDILISSLPGSNADFVIPPIRASLPGPEKRPKILRQVTIKNMKLGTSRTGDDLVASGLLIATFALPEQVSEAAALLDLRRLWPDTLVFDGPPPAHNFSEATMRSSNKDAPLPNPLPERAFARIRAPDWLPAETLPDTNTTEKGVKTVIANIVEVPLEILPGRDDIFRSFVGKILMSRGAGALAGVRGTTSIGVHVEGLSVSAADKKKKRPAPPDGEIELDGLDFEGTVIVGRKSFLPSFWDHGYA